MFWWQLGLVGAGGAVGTIARFLTSKAFATLWPAYPAAGTLVVNVLGSLAIGFLMGMAATRPHSDDWRVFLVSGMLGGFTTFSALAYETNLFWSQNHTVWIGWSHLAANIIIGLAAAALGDALARMMAV
jgi:CrcB protein